MADQAAAEAAYRAARKTMALFGLSESAIDEVENTRKIETEMPVLSPFSGRVISRAGAVGQLVQPGNTPAPLTVANIKNLWLVANVPESELTFYQKGQQLKVKVQAHPHASFDAKVNYVGDSVDPNTHRIVVRADVTDPKHLLRPQMLANFSITVGMAAENPALPMSALVRESDGNMSVWIAEDQGNFQRRTVTVGMVQNNMFQIISGLKVGEKVAHNKALFLSNLYLTSIN
jgi:cobalt-zinc-cadmium efflux system membrane fusion protein